MVFVFGLVLIDVTILTIHTILEGAIANFRAGTVVNKEKPMALEGVSLTFFVVHVCIIFLADIMLYFLQIRTWKSKPNILFTPAQ